MTNRNRLRSLTLIALMNAFVIALIAVQLVIPLAFVPLLCIVPTVFAIETYIAPIRLTLLSCLIVIGVAALGFGLAVGLWAAVYVLAGVVAGLTRRWKWPIVARDVALALVLLALVGGAVTAFTLLAGLSLTDLLGQASDVVARGPKMPVAAPIEGILVVGGAIFVITFAILIDRLLNTILSRLPIKLA
ncbi:MAG TPA: hypothetical protein VFX24_11660 [Ktedonobacterales bacterium]|jgi:hypothetical protein|nr:hypothetical protein [Ktedonobacterales bacterium]